MNSRTPDPGGWKRALNGSQDGRRYSATNNFGMHGKAFAGPIAI